MKRWLAVFALFAVAACACANALAATAPLRVLVTIRTGALAGTSVDGITVFKGIPYAAPPLGDLRWRAPQPPARWHGVRQATQFGAACPQRVLAVLGASACPPGPRTTVTSCS